MQNWQQPKEIYTSEKVRKRFFFLEFGKFFTFDKFFYYIPINDTSFELSIFWLSDTDNRIDELRFFLFRITIL